MPLDEAELARASQRFARSLDGRWQVAGLASTDVAYAVWVFRGGGGHREAKGSSEAFAIAWLGPRVVRLDWANGDSDELEYEFTIVSDTARQLALCSRGRAVFAFEAAPLVRIGDF